MNEKINQFLKSRQIVFILLSLSPGILFSSISFGYGCRSYDDFRSYDSYYYEIDEPFQKHSLEAIYQESQLILDQMKQATAKEDFRAVSRLHYPFLKTVRAIPLKSKMLSQQRYVYVEQTVKELVSIARKLHRITCQDGNKALASELLDTLNIQLQTLKAYQG